MPDAAAIEGLLAANPKLWRGRRFSRGQRALPTGHARLDARLPGGGWPLGAVTELIADHPGRGEFSLLFPALAALGGQGQWVVLVDPPWIPYPATLQAHGLDLGRLLLVRSNGEGESLWACEQTLRCGQGGSVLAWPGRIDFAQLRRLQLAAEAHAKLAFLFRPASALRDASPAALRLLLESGERGGTRVRVLKCRGSRPPEAAWLPRPFPVFENAPLQTSQHALARPALAASRPGPVYAGRERPEDPARGQLRH